MTTKHLSHSRISCYTQCPRRFKYRYIDQVETPTSVYLAFGSAAHDCVERKILRPDGPSLVDLWERSWRNQLNKHREIAWGNKSEDATYKTGEAIFSDPDVVQLVESLVPQVSSDGAAYVEHYLEFSVKGIDVPFVGYVDIITDDGVAGDFKTSSRPWDAKKARMEFQPLFYLAGLWDTGIDARPSFRHYIFTKKRPGVQVLETPISEERVVWGLDLARSVWRGITAGVFPACNPLSWWCSPKWCEYWDVCERI